MEEVQITPAQQPQMVLPEKNFLILVPLEKAVFSQEEGQDHGTQERLEQAVMAAEQMVEMAHPIKMELMAQRTLAVVGVALAELTVIHGQEDLEVQGSC